MTQCNLIIKYLNDFGSITTFESYTELGITRLPSRIYDLKKLGYKFNERWIYRKNRYGRSIKFKRYELIGGLNE